MRRLSTHSAFTAFGDVLRTLDPFATRGALKGVDNWELMCSTGKLHLREEWKERYVRAWEDHRLHYVVYSYDTPIAWFETIPGEAVRGEWAVPDIRYSVTTSRHQSKIRAALSASAAPVSATPDVRDPYADLPSRRPNVADRPIPAHDGDGAIYSTEYLTARAKEAGLSVERAY